MSQSDVLAIFTPQAPVEQVAAPQKYDGADDDGFKRIMDDASNKVSSPKEGNKSDADRQDAPSAQSHPEKKQIEKTKVKELYSSYYTKKSFYALMFLLGNCLSELEPRKRLSTWKRLLDYFSIFLARNDELFAFHREINQILLKQTKEYSHYDYGEGYFYQSFPSAYISGFRDTTERVKHLDLREITKNKSVLDIGCNTGFILISLADSYKSGFGFDFNPYLIEIADATKSFRKLNNTNFSASSFENIDIEESYDVVLSLANHSTYDGNTKQDLGSYFKKISDVLNKGGIMVFESHPPAIENTEQLDKTLGAIRKVFQIEKKIKLPLKGFLDKNRTYVIAKKIER